MKTKSLPLFNQQALEEKTHSIDQITDQTTGIEWTDLTWNFLIGCTKVNIFCTNCYAIQEAHIHKSHPNPKISSAYAGTTEKKGCLVNWTGKINFIESRLAKPLKLKSAKKIFVNSMSDLFHDQVSDEIIYKFLAIVALAPDHTYQILTKRPKRAMNFFTKVDFDLLKRYVKEAKLTYPKFANKEIDYIDFFKSIWLGLSTNNGEGIEYLFLAANVGIPVIFVSLEPLLSRVDIRDYYQYINWLIVGCESGKNRRPFSQDWVRQIVAQAKEVNLPVFYKQGIDQKTGKVVSLPLLDGKKYTEFPKIK